MYGTRHKGKTYFVNSISSPQEENNKGVLFNHVLLAVLVVMFLTLVAGTVVAFTKNKAEIGTRYRHADPTPKQVISASLSTDSKLSAYTDLGQIRVVTKSPDKGHTGTLIIVSPWFSYPSSDTPLFEELAQKSQKEKSIIVNYFGQKTRQELLTMGEQAVKKELKERINNELVLGTITNVYFDQYLFFD